MLIRWIKKVLVLLVQISPQCMCFRKLCVLRNKQTWAGAEAEAGWFNWQQKKKGETEKLNVIKWHVKCLFLGYVLASCCKGLHTLQRIACCIKSTLVQVYRIQRYLFIKHKCSACYKQFKKKEHLIEHMKTSNHSVHQPACGVCQKHCKSFESLREHLTGPLPKGVCSKTFSQRGCQLCLVLFDSPGSLIGHRETCRLSAPTRLGTKELTCIDSQFDCQDSSDENHAGRGPGGTVAMDCEMVGAGSDGSLELCARVCLVDEDENLIFHTYVKPLLPVTNYRYDITGLTEEHLRNAMPLYEVREKVLKILYNGESIGKVRLNGGKARLLVGHDLAHDLDCLKMNYPDHMLRDTAKYRPLMKTNLVSHSLKYLTRTYLGYDIQSGTHDPYEDCVSVMRLYKRIRAKIHPEEEDHETSTPSNRIVGVPDCWRSKELDNLTPDQLYAMSRSDYKCWCLDLRPSFST